MAESSRVLVVDLGLSRLSETMERFCQDALREGAEQVAARMVANIEGRGDTGAFFDTGATAGSVTIGAPDSLTREIGPTTSYAFYGEEGWVQTTAWGHPIKRGAIVHPAIRFAAMALKAVAPSFIETIRRGVRALGKESG